MSECGEQASPHLVIDVVIQPAEGAEEACGERVPCPRPPGPRLRDHPRLTAVRLSVSDGQGRRSRFRGNRSSSAARRTAARRLVTASLA
jgi:hypothetical protein